MTDTSALHIPPPVSARQALHALRGFAYQLYATAEAWATLPDGAVLLVKVAEDFAIAADEALRMVQVKDDPSANTTLRSEGVVKTLDTLWAMRTANPGAAIQACYLSTSGVGREREQGFRMRSLASTIGATPRPGNGIWRRCAQRWPRCP